jgi:hypothetical protein
MPSGLLVFSLICAYDALQVRALIHVLFVCFIALIALIGFASDCHGA